MALWDQFPILLAHHHPEDYDHCVVVGERPVCRRCLALYPFTGLVLAAQFTPMSLTAELEPWLFALALPATLEFVLERLERVHYNSRRVVIGSFLLAIPLGRAFFYYLQDPLDVRFWGMVAGCGIPALAASLWRSWSDYQRSTK